MLRLLQVNLCRSIIGDKLEPTDTAVTPTDTAVTPTDTAVTPTERGFPEVS